jgi:hypothetical protein
MSFIPTCVGPVMMYKDARPALVLLETFSTHCFQSPSYGPLLGGFLKPPVLPVVTDYLGH